MTKRERVYASIRRRPLDAIPWQFDLTGAVVDRLKAYLKTDDVFGRAGRPLRLRLDAGRRARRRTRLCRRATTATRSASSGGGTRWTAPSATGAATSATRCTSRAWRATGSPSRLADPSRTRYIPQARQQHPDHFLWMGGGSLFELAWSLCGFENYLGYLAGEEAFVEELTEKLADDCCRDMSLLKGTGLDAVRFGDDWGFQHSLMIRPEIWRRIYKKQYARIFQAAHDSGLVVMMHSCGHVEDIIADLIDIGLDVLHPLQPEANDVIRCRREFGEDITFWGALGSQSTLPLGTPDARAPRGARAARPLRGRRLHPGPRRRGPGRDAGREHRRHRRRGAGAGGPPLTARCASHVRPGLTVLTARCHLNADTRASVQAPRSGGSASEGRRRAP